MMKKIAAVLTALMVSVLPLQAEETPVPEENTEEITEQTETEEGGEAAEPTPEPTPEPVYLTEAAGAVLIDTTSGSVLYEQNKDSQLDPASLTKLMTVYLGVKELSPSKELTMSEQAFETYDHNFGVLWFEIGETMSAESMEHAAMLASANDAAAMIAEGVSGSQEAFLAKMNSTASELGMTHTHFQNIFGLNNFDNYSSAYDLAVLLRKALGEEQFRKVFTASAYTIPSTNVTGSVRNLVNDCALLRDTGYYTEYVEGGKIGNTNEGGFALAAAAKKNGMELIAVVLGESNADKAYRDIVTLFDYGFDSFQSISFSSEEIGEKLIEVMKGRKHVADVRFYVDTDYHVLLPAGLDSDTLKAEITVNNEEESNPEVITADIIFTLDGLAVGTAPMEKEITRYDTGLNTTLLPQMRMIFDYACIAVLGLFIFRGFLGIIHKLLAPPQ